LTWHGAASVRMKLKGPATQRHHHKCAAHARWLAISSSVSLWTAYIF